MREEETSGKEMVGNNLMGIHHHMASLSNPLTIVKASASELKGLALPFTSRVMLGKPLASHLQSEGNHTYLMVSLKRSSKEEYTKHLQHYLTQKSAMLLILF